MIQGEGEEEAQIQEYRLRNKYLRRQLRQKDVRIMQLFDCIEQASSRLVASTPHSQIAHTYHSPQAQKHSHRKAQISYSERKKEKESANGSQLESSNIFRQKSYLIVEKGSRKDLHLPALDKRTRIEFIYPKEDSIIENPQGRPKIVRVPLDRLKPLNSKEVKKRFMMKFQKREESQQLK